MPSNADCPIRNRQQEILLDYVAQRLTVSAARKVTVHAASCMDCQDFLTEQAKLWSALDTFEPPAVSEDFDQRLVARIAQEERAGWWIRAWRRAFLAGQTGTLHPAAVSALCAILAVGAICVSNFRQSSTSHPESAISEQPVREPYAADAMEAALDDLEMLQVLSSSGASL